MALLRKKTKGEWTARKLVLEGGWENSTGFTIVQSGTKSDGGSKMPLESGIKKRRLQRKNGSGKQVLSRIFSVKANGTEGISA